MKNGNKNDNLKEKLIQALNSTAKVISDDLGIKNNIEEKKRCKKTLE